MIRILHLEVPARFILKKMKLHLSEHEYEILLNIISQALDLEVEQVTMYIAF